MAGQGRYSLVARHPQVDRINSMLDDGVPYAVIASKFGVSLAGVGRYALSRKSELANLLEGQPAVTDITLRLLEAADHARDARRLSKSSSPYAQTKAIATEASILGKLLGDIGISDTRQADLEAQVSELINALAEHADAFPDSARQFLETMRAHPALSQLTEALARRMEQNS